MADFGFRKRGKVEYLRVMYERYRQAERSTRTALLDEFCVATGYNRKYAIRPLNGPLPGKEQVRQPRGRKPRYRKKVMSVLTAVWKAAGYPWSVRLKALLPSWMPWIRKRFRLNQMLEKELLAMSAPDGPPTPESKTRTEAQDLWAYQTRCAVKAPYPGENGQLGVCRRLASPEVNLVSHSGNSAEGEFTHTLYRTDTHTGWTESRAVLGKSEIAVQQALNEIQAGLPFRLLGVDSDNGSKFINSHLKRWCGQNGLSHRTWESPKRHGIPTLPQPPRRAFGYIFYVSIAAPKVTFSNVLTQGPQGVFADFLIPFLTAGQSAMRSSPQP